MRNFPQKFISQIKGFFHTIINSGEREEQRARRKSKKFHKMCERLWSFLSGKAREKKVFFPIFPATASSSREEKWVVRARERVIMSILRETKEVNPDRNIFRNVFIRLSIEALKLPSSFTIHDSRCVSLKWRAEWCCVSTKNDPTQPSQSTFNRDLSLVKDDKSESLAGVKSKVEKL